MAAESPGLDPHWNEQPSSTATPKGLRSGGNLAVWIVVLGIVFGFAALVVTALSSGLNAWERSKLGPLLRAACDGDAAECERLVKSGSPVDTTDAQGETALDWAIYRCKLDVVQKLVDLGADVNHADQRGGYTPLMYTVRPFRGKGVMGTKAERNDIARILIQHGADVNHAIGDGHVLGDGQTTLHFAAADKNAELVRMLLAAGANPNVRSNQGYTPLDVAKFPDYAPNDDVISALEAEKAPKRNPPRR
jgi:ankyrin repeat protein